MWKPVDIWPSIFGGAMFTYTKPFKPAVRKPLNAAIRKQLERRDRLERFDRAMLVIFGVMGLFLVMQAI